MLGGASSAQNAVMVAISSGVRHFVLDAGAGYELDANKTWSVLTTVGGIVLTAAFWAVLVLL